MKNKSNNKIFEFQLFFQFLFPFILIFLISCEETSTKPEEPKPAYSWEVKTLVYNNITREGIIGVRVKLYYTDLNLTKEWRQNWSTDSKTTEQNGKCIFKIDNITNLAIKKVKVFDNSGNILYEESKNLEDDTTFGFKGTESITLYIYI
jgi:hypothetical protein